MSAFEILRERGFVQQHTEAVPQLLQQPGVVVYCGVDPTGESLHVGHMVPLMALAHLQRAGCRPIAVVGGGTAMVGDPSGKDEMRQLITPEHIAQNIAGIRPQVGRLVDLAPGQGLLLNNADWLGPLNYITFLRDIGRHFSVNTMLSKASVQLRLEKGLSFIEFNYQILQAYDFLELHRAYGCTLQIGGDDQWGNITAGIDLIRRVHQAEAHGLTVPLITTASGAKMGKTAAGAVWLSADRLSPYDYFQYWMNVADADVGRFLRLFTFLPMDEIRRLDALEGAELREAKRVLALEATRLIHGDEAAERALAGALAAFGGGGSAADMPTLAVTLPTPVVKLLVDAGLCSSNSDARRQIQQGAVSVGAQRETPITEVTAQLGPEHLGPEGAAVLWKGKKHAVRVVAG